MRLRWRRRDSLHPEETGSESVARRSTGPHHGDERQDPVSSKLTVTNGPPSRPMSEPSAAASANGSIAGVVTYPDGRPVRNSGVSAQVIAPPGMLVPDRAVRTRSDGTYRLVLPPATYQVTATSSDATGHALRANAYGIEVQLGRTTELDLGLALASAPPDETSL